MPRAKGQVRQDEANWFFELCPETRRYFSVMKYNENTLSNKKSNLRDLLGIVSLNLDRDARVTDTGPEDLVLLASSLDEREYKPSTIQSRCSNLQHDLIGGQLGGWADGTPFGLRRLDQMQKRLRDLSRAADISKAQLLYRPKTNALEISDQTILATWCLSGFRRSSWRFLCSVSGTKDTPLVIRSNKCKVLPWSLPCFSLIGCNCKSSEISHLCPPHSLGGLKIDAIEMAKCHARIMEEAGGTGHSARRTMAYWLRYVYENRAHLKKAGVLNSGAASQIQRALNLSMNWAANSKMLFTTYSLDFGTHDPREVFDLLAGAVNSINLSLAALGLGDEGARLFCVSEADALELLDQETFDPC